jgi:SAM-dependent methyltransferase
MTKEDLEKGYLNTFENKPTAKEYVTLEGSNSNDPSEFAIYGNRLANWLADRLKKFSCSSIYKGEILEIGCGMGRIMKPLSIRFKKVYGVDISASILQEAQEYLRDIPNVSLHENDGKSLALFADASFDYVLSAGVLQHIPYREVIENYMKEGIRVLKDGGLFLVAFQVWQTKEEGNGRIGAKVTADWLEKVFVSLPVELLEVTYDPNDPIPHMSLVIRKSAKYGGVRIKREDILGVAWRTVCWEDLDSMVQLRVMQQKGQRAITFFDAE